MKLVKVIFAGVAIWAVSLIWPQVNQWLSYNTMLWGMIGLSSFLLGYTLRHHLRRHKVAENLHHPPQFTDTRPFHPLGMV